MMSRKIKSKALAQDFISSLRRKSFFASMGLIRAALSENGSRTALLEP